MMLSDGHYLVKADWPASMNALVTTHQVKPSDVIQLKVSGRLSLLDQESEQHLGALTSASGAGVRSEAAEGPQRHRDPQGGGPAQERPLGDPRLAATLPAG
jgi:hypothetical protein